MQMQSVRKNRERNHLTPRAVYNIKQQHPQRVSAGVVVLYLVAMFFCWASASVR